MEAEKNDVGGDPQVGTELNKLVRSVGPAAFDGVHILSRSPNRRIEIHVRAVLTQAGGFGRP